MNTPSESAQGTAFERLMLAQGKPAPEPFTELERAAYEQTMAGVDRAAARANRAAA